MKFFLSTEFLTPFLSTTGASLTIILLSFINRYIKNRTKKLYAIAYITDICFRELLSSFILKKNTILPHIEATKRIISGDNNLLNTMFLSDEFDILTDAPFDYNLLSEEYKILIGNDDIDLIQAYEFITYTTRNNATQQAFNGFVKDNLKSQHSFSQRSLECRNDILTTYWDYLDKIKHGHDRNISFIIELHVPHIRSYIKGKQFWLFPKKNIRKSLLKIERTISKFKDVIPEKDMIKNLATGGIQNIL